MATFAQGPRDPGATTRSAAEAYLQAVRLLALGDREMRVALAQFAKPHGLSETQALVMHCCHRPEGRPGVSQSELAEHVGVSPAQISDTVDRLRARALIVGQRSAGDRRRQVWLATAAGRQCVDQMLSDLETWAVPFFASLAEEESPLDDLLGQILAAARHANSQAGNDPEAGQEPCVPRQQRKVA